MGKGPEFDGAGAMEEAEAILQAPTPEEEMQFSVTLNGNYAYDFASRMFDGIDFARLSREFFSGAALKVGIDIPPEEIEKYNPESPYFMIFESLASQVGITIDNGSIVPPKSIPDTVILTLSTSAMDELNDDSLRLMANAFKWSRLKDKHEDLASNPVVLMNALSLGRSIYDFVTLNTAFVRAGGPPRPAFSRFLESMDSFTKTAQS